MELLVEVRIRDRETGAESVLWTNLEPKKAFDFIDYALAEADLNNMPEYIVRPYLYRPARRTKYEDIQKKLFEVSKPESNR